jgi:glycosyltransferase involved in cell wall biosynthesis
MRVSLVDPSAFTPPYDRSLAAALARAGVEVELITSRFLYGPVPDPRGYRVHEDFYALAARAGADSRLRIAAKAAGHLPGMLRARRRLRVADVTHWQWVSWPPLDGPLLDRLGMRGSGGPPTVFTHHPPLPEPGDRGGLERRRRFLAGFDAVIAHTAEAARRLREEARLDPASIHLIPHGPLEYLTELPEERPLPAELAGAEGPVVLFFGLLRPYKGVDVLLEAFAEVEGAELWIAGMPRMPLEPLRKLAARAPGRVRLLPRFIPDPEIPALLRRADLLVLPYRQVEQSGVLYAGLAFGKAMILSDVGGLAEVAREHGAGRLVPAGDAAALATALRGLIADPAERERLAAAARAAAAGAFSWDAIAARTIELYRSLGAGGAR